MIKRRPYIIFWSFSIVLLLISYIHQIILEDTVIDINIHDTYFVIAHYQVYVFFILWFLVCGLIYWVLKRLKFNWIDQLVIVHTSTCILLVFQVLPSFEMVDVPRRYYENTAYPNQSTIWPIVAWLIIIMGQFLFLLNILISIFRKKI